MVSADVPEYFNALQNQPAVKPFGRVMETWLEPPLAGECEGIPSEKKPEEPEEPRPWRVCPDVLLGVEGNELVGGGGSKGCGLTGGKQTLFG